MPEEKTQAAAAVAVAVAAAIDGGSGAVWSELEMVQFVSWWGDVEFCCLGLVFEIITRMALGVVGWRVEGWGMDGGQIGQMGGFVCRFGGDGDGDGDFIACSVKVHFSVVKKCIKNQVYIWQR